MPTAVRDLPYPEIPSRHLSNGLTVLVVEDQRLPRVGVRLSVEAGRIHNPDDNLSLIPLGVELVKEGTSSRSAQQIAELMDREAIQYDCDIRLEYSEFSMDCLSDRLATALELLSDMLRQPVFPQRELDQLKVRWHSELLAQRSMPSYLSEERLHQTVYPEHPYRKWSMSVEQLAAADRSQVVEVYRHRFVPSRSILLLAGAVHPEEGFELAERYWGQWRGGTSPQPQFPAPAEAVGCRVEVVHRPHSEQARLVLAVRTFPRRHPDSHPFRVANQVLGGGASSRLFLNIREEKGYTYGIYSQLRSYRRDGLGLVSADVRSDAAADSVREVFAEFRRLQDKPAGAAEISRSRSELAGGFLFYLETPASTGMLEVTRRLYDLPEDYFRTFVQQVESVSAEQVQQMARRYLDPLRTTVVAVGDRAALEGPLAEFGPVQVYDTEGKRL